MRRCRSRWARLAGERYLGISVDRERHAADLKAALGGIKPADEGGRLLATIPDAPPKEYVNELVRPQVNGLNQLQQCLVCRR